MSQSTPLQVPETIQTIRLNPKFKHEVAREEGGDSIRFCFQCGKCTATCPVRRLESTYKPRQIIRATLLGLKELVLSSDTIWLCASCFSCTERCPQGVKLTDVMRALRNIAVREGHIHPFYKAQSKMIASFGRIFDDDAFINELRDELGLPQIPIVNTQQVAKILEPTRINELLESEEEE